jgi:hypothetical protein
MAESHAVPSKNSGAVGMGLMGSVEPIIFEEWVQRIHRYLRKTQKFSNLRGFLVAYKHFDIFFSLKWGQK